MEKIVLKRLCQFVHAEHLLPDNQFTFRPHHSTEDSNTVAVDSLLTATDHSHRPQPQPALWPCLGGHEQGL